MQTYFTKLSNYLEDGRFGIEDFYASDHLNTEGAIKFSKLLAIEALSRD